MPLEQLEPIAGGRVWTGSQALELGLVDQIGGQLQAIESAANLAELDDYQIHHIEPQLTFSELLVKNFLDSVDLNLQLSEASWAGKLFKLLETVEESPVNLFLTDPQHMYLHCDLCIKDL